MVRLFDGMCDGTLLCTCSHLPVVCVRVFWMCCGQSCCNQRWIRGFYLGRLCDCRWSRVYTRMRRKGKKAVQLQRTRTKKRTIWREISVREREEREVAWR